MKRLLHAEWGRLKWTRSLWAVPAAGLVISVVSGTVLVVAFKEHEIAARLSEHGPLRFGISNLGLVVGLFGIRILGDEIHHGTLSNTLLRVPARTRVLCVKLIVAATVAAALVATVYAFTVPIVLAARSARGLTMVLDFQATGGLLVRNIAAMTLLASAGVGLAACCRNRTVALIAFVLWTGFGETIVGAVLRISEYMPGALVQSLMSGHPEGGPGAALSFALLAGLAAALNALGSASLRRDVD